MAETDLMIPAGAGYSRLVEISMEVVKGGMTPNELRQVRDMSGVPLSKLLDDGDMDTLPEKGQMMVWISMRRAGTPCTWEEAADMLGRQQTEAPPEDPTGRNGSVNSPPSAGTGG